MTAALAILTRAVEIAAVIAVAVSAINVAAAVWAARHFIGG